MRTRSTIRRFILDDLIEERPAGDPLAENLLDSLAIEQLVAFCEDEFGVAFEDTDLVAENFESLGAVTALVDRKRRA